MYRKIRIATALLIFAGLTLCFIDFTGKAAKALWYLPHTQLIPALFALNIAAMAGIGAVTLLFGRLYCSVLCPLGIFQDIIIRIRQTCISRRKRRAGIFRYKAPNKKLRYGVAIVFSIFSILGLAGLASMSLASILDPYSIFGRAAGQFLSPLSRMVALPIADYSASNGIYLLDSVPPNAPLALAVAIVAGTEMAIIVAFAWLGGRDYCNTICPVGTILGMVSRVSWFKVHINTRLCNSCGSCGRHCKAGCIDTKNHSIDYSRCITCLDCLDVCKQGAISFSLPKRHSDAGKFSGSRRVFLSGAAIATSTLIANAIDKTTDGGLARVKDKKPHNDIQLPVPAGSTSIAHLRSHCTACQLCISACPSGVLRPSLNPAHFMQPEIVFTTDFCRTGCTICATVCPTGAIRPIEPSEKAVTKIGKAVVDTEKCISSADGQHCGSCARHCPTGAIVMIEMPNGRKRPAVDNSRCIGCGSCENHCPVGTVGILSSTSAAIYVVGLDTHIKI